MRAGLVLAVALALAVLGAGNNKASAQLRVRPVDLEDGAVALGLVLRQLDHHRRVYAGNGAS